MIDLVQKAPGADATENLAQVHRRGMLMLLDRGRRLGLRFRRRRLRFPRLSAGLTPHRFDGLLPRVEFHFSPLALGLPLSAVFGQFAGLRLDFLPAGGNLRFIRIDSHLAGVQLSLQRGQP